jgi:hypothetical protein
MLPLLHLDDGAMMLFVTGDFLTTEFLDGTEWTLWTRSRPMNAMMNWRFP